MSIKIALLDLDGVLCNAVQIHYQALNDALQNVCNYVITKDEHEHTFNGLPTKTKLQKLIERGTITSEDAEEVWSKKQEYTIKAINHFLKRDEEKIKLHEYLKQKSIKTACITNSIRQTAELMLKNTEQFDYLEFVITNEDVSAPKPSPEGYLKAMEKFGVSSDEVLIVEDSPKGIMAGKASGAKVIEVSGVEMVNMELFKKYFG